MRVGVELMMTNISVAKSSLLAVEDHAGHVDGLRFVRALVQVELQRGQAVLAVDDQELAVRLLQLPTMSWPSSERKLSFSLVNSSTVPGIGGWVTAVS